MQKSKLCNSDNSFGSLCLQNTSAFSPSLSVILCILDREELSRRAIVLVEENLRLRVLLLAAVSCDKSPDRSASPSAVVGQVEVREGDEEEPGMADGLGEGGAEEASLPLPSEMTVEADGGVCSTNADSSVDDQEREDVSGATEESTEKETSSGGGREEREKGGDLGFEEPEERDGLGSERNSSSNREGGAGNEDIGSGGDGEQVEGEKEHDKRIEVRETANTGEKENNKDMEVRELANWDGESSAAVDQSWPISSLLSDQTRSGPPPPPPPREHQMAAFGLPILSPTYIAEHCSTSGSDQQFFGPTTTAASLPPVTSYTSVADTRPVSSQNSPLFAGGLPISRVTEFSRSQLATVSYSSLSVLSASSSSLHCSNSPQQISLAASLRPPPTRQSIVQPWVGTHSSSGSGPLSASRRSSVVSRSSTTTTSQTANDQHGLLLRPQPESATTPSPGFHRGALPMTHQATTPRQSRYSSRTSHSIPSTRASRTVSSRGHAHTPYYLDRSRHNVHHNLSSVEVASVGGFPPSSQSLGHANLSFDGRGQSYCPGGVPSLLPSTAAPFHGYTSGPMPHQSRQPPGFSTSSIDPYYHCTVYQSQQSSSFSFLPPPHGHISPGSRHSQFTPHHPHQHNYTTLPPPPPPHPLHPPPFHHQHPPSHQNTVWRPYSDRRQTSLTRFSLSDILSPSPAPLPSLGLPAAVSPPAIHHQQPRIPSFFVDHLLDDL